MKWEGTTASSSATVFLNVTLMGTIFVILMFLLLRSLKTRSDIACANNLGYFYFDLGNFSVLAESS